MVSKPCKRQGDVQASEGRVHCGVTGKPCILAAGEILTLLCKVRQVGGTLTLLYKVRQVVKFCCFCSLKWEQCKDVGNFKRGMRVNCKQEALLMLALWYCFMWGNVLGAEL